MKNPTSYFLAILVAVSVNLSSAVACEEYSAEEQISFSTSVDKLLKKMSTRLDAECELPFTETTWGVTVNYQAGDDTRTSGTIKRTFQGNISCLKPNGSVRDEEITGAATIKYKIHRGNDSCNGSLFTTVKKIKVKARY